MGSEIRCFSRALRKAYGRHLALKDCTFVLHAGEMIGLMGENGSGKSTLVRCMLGFTRPDFGEVGLDPSIGYCPQNDYLNERITLAEHLKLVKIILSGRHSVDDNHMRRLLELLKLDEFTDRRLGQLSSGSLQKVKFLTSILHRPRLIILDEPTDGFDWGMYLVFWDIISGMKEEGAAILMISHMLYDRERFNRLYELREGTLEETVASI